MVESFRISPEYQTMVGIIQSAIAGSNDQITDSAQYPTYPLSFWLVISSLRISIYSFTTGSRLA